MDATHFKQGDLVAWDCCGEIRKGVFVRFSVKGFALVKRGGASEYLFKLDECNLRKI